MTTIDQNTTMLLTTTLQAEITYIHRWATEGFDGSEPPLRLKIWVDPPLENFRAGYPLEKHSRGSVGDKLTPPLPPKSN